MAASDGVGLNREQLTTRMSMSVARVLVFCSSSSMHVNMTYSASFRAASMVSTGGLSKRPASGAGAVRVSPGRARGQAGVFAR